MNRALITGIRGQDGSFLAERLLAEGWEIHGIERPGRSTPEGDETGLTVHTCDIADTDRFAEVIRDVLPTHVFHLAGSTSVAASWADPAESVRVNCLPTVTLLDTCLALGDEHGIAVRVVNASSGEIFAGTAVAPQDESTPPAPTSPYGAAKTFGLQMGQIYRGRGLHVGSAILYNHESTRRPEQFVSRKIVQTVARIARGSHEKLHLGNIDGERDWGWAPDYVDCMYRMATAETAGDFIVASGESHTVRDFLIEAFAVVGISDWEEWVVIDADLVRPIEPLRLVGNPGKAQRELGWSPTMTFGGMVRAMVENELS